jgi:vitamin B12 transporter
MIKYLGIFLILLSTVNLYASLDSAVTDPLVVSANRSATRFSDIGRKVTIITREEIRNAPVTNIHDLLEFVSSVDIRTRGAEGVQSDVNMRGGNFEQTLIMINGVKVNDPQTGHHNLNLPIEKHDIKRIEILEGPGSRIFGPNAYSGAINIITGSGFNGNETQAHVAAGDFGLWDLNLSNANQIGDFSSYISATRRLSGGFMENTDFDITNFFINSGYKAGHGTYSLQAGYNDKSFGAFGFYTPNYPDQYEQTRTTFTSLHFETGEDIKFKPTVYWRRHQDRFELFRNEAPDWYTNHNYHLTDTYGAELNTEIRSDFGVSSIGLEFRSENIKSNVLGKPTGDTIKAPGESNGFFSKSDSRENYSLFLEHLFDFDKLLVSLGGIANYNSEFDFKAYGGFELNYKLSQNYILIGSLNQSLRMPTFTDLYYKVGDHRGSPDLEPEEGLTAELGFKFRNEYLRFDLIGFNRWGRNIIDWVKETPEDELWVARNVTKLNTVGMETSLSFLPKQLIGEQCKIKYINLAYSFNQVYQDSEDYLSQYVLDYLKHKFTGSIEHEIGGNLSMNWMMNYQFRVGKYEGKRLGDGSSPAFRFDPFFILNVKLAYTYEDAVFFVECSNVLDTEYRDFYVPQPGRWAKGGINVIIN